MRDKKTLFWLQSGSYSGDTLSILNMDDPDLFTQFKHMGIEVNLSPDLSTKPTQNAFIESLNGKFRNEYLNQHWFRRPEEARFKIDRWRDHYNNVRPHSSLGYLPPVEFARSAA